MFTPVEATYTCEHSSDGVLRAGLFSLTVTIQIRLLHDVLHEIRQLLHVVAHLNDRTVRDVFTSTLHVVRDGLAPLNLLLHSPTDFELEPIAQDLVAFLASLSFLSA